MFKASYENLGRLSSGAQQPLHLDRTLFLDTETTGLAGGTGTYAFLVGLGFHAYRLCGEAALDAGL